MLSPENESNETVSEDPNQVMKQRTLAYLGARLAEMTYPGYPGDRFWVPQKDLAAMTDEFGRLQLPDGQWALWAAPSTKVLELPTDEEIERFSGMGLKFDTKNRPLHPWINEMITDPGIGVVTGNGFYWNWGPNYTADTVITNKDTGSVLLITRRDTGQWALPGGFVDTGESPQAAAVREVFEESGLIIAHMADRMKKVYEGPVADIRVTANAWAETTAYVIDVGWEGPVYADDDAIEAAWIQRDEVQQKLNFGSHSLLVELALKQL